MQESATPFCFTGILEPVRYAFEPSMPFTGEPRETLGPRHLPFLDWLENRVDLLHPVTTIITQAEFITAGGNAAGFCRLIEVLDAAIWTGAAAWHRRIRLSQISVYSDAERVTVVFRINPDAGPLIQDLLHRARAAGHLAAAADPSQNP